METPRVVEVAGPERFGVARKILAEAQMLIQDPREYFL